MSTVADTVKRKIVRAGAGAGKTYTLTRQVIGQALEFRKTEGNWPNTVVTTFTRKATQELRERILEYCIKEAPEAIEFAHSSQYLFITTIHGLFDRLLRSHGKTLGLPTQYQLKDDVDQELLRKKILREIFTENRQFSDLLEKFTFKSVLKFLKEFEHIDEHVLDDFAGVEDQERSARTYFDILMKDLREFLPVHYEIFADGKGLEYVQGLQRIGDVSDESWSQLLHELDLATQALPKRPISKDERNSDSLKKKVNGTLGKIKKMLADPIFQPDLWAQSVLLFRTFAQLSRLYRQRLLAEKIKAGELEVNDLEGLALRLAHQHPDVVEQFGQEYDQWFIDEFQDTSPLQLQVLKPLMAHGQNYLVGDPQQSIYLFRGARSQVFNETRDEIVAEGGIVEELPFNWRSQEALLNCFNYFFPRLHENFSTMGAKNPTVDEVSLQIGVVTEDDRKFEIELNQMILQIRQLLDSGVAPKDIAVLCRKRDQLDLIERRLLNLGYPCLSHASSGFFARQEIRDAMSFLSVLTSPADDFSLIQFLRSPYMPMSDQKIVDVINRRKQNFWPLFKKYFTDEKWDPGLRLLQFQELAWKFGIGYAFRKGLVHFGFFDSCYIADSSGRREANLWKLVNLIEKGSREPGTPIMQFLRDETRGLDLEGTQTEDASSAIVPDKINLMTVHSSKGLEFDYVFLPFTGRKTKTTNYRDFAVAEDIHKWVMRVPLGEYGQSIGSPVEKMAVAKFREKELEESDRLLYVAMTRAKLKLFISWTEKADQSSWAPKIKGILNCEAGVHEEKGFKYQVHDWDQGTAEEYNKESREFLIPAAYNELVDRFALTEEKKSGSARKPSSVDEFLESQNKRAFGVIMHKYFEKLKLMEPDEVAALIEAEVSYNIDTVLEAFHYVINHNELPILEVIKQGEVEWFFQKIVDGERSEGRVDLWGIVDDTLYVVDYKTGSSRYKDSAFEQLVGYAEKIKEYLAGKQIAVSAVKLIALYPFEKKFFIA